MYADSHVEFIHHPDDLSSLADPQFLINQINTELIQATQPELLFLACFVDPNPNAWKKLQWVIEQYRATIESNGWIFVKSKADLQKQGIKIILHVEDLHAIGNDLGKIQTLFDLGIRSIGLTHNHVNQFAGGSLAKEGITPLGYAAINQILDHGMIFDAAHLSPAAFHDLVTTTDITPFISHTGILGAYPNPRNVHDSVLTAIKQKNGYCGVGFAGSFLAKAHATIDDALNQITYAMQKAGPQNVGIGSDFGGIISFLPERLTSIQDIPNLIERLPEETISGQNLLDFIERSSLIDGS